MPATLSGTVTVHRGPARHATVELHNATGDVVDQVQVDDSGHFTYHLPPGKWSLNIWDPYGHRGSTEVTVDKDESKQVFVALVEPKGGHRHA